MTEQTRVTLKNGVKIYPFRSFDETIDYALEKKCMLIAVNPEKVMCATDQTRQLINDNIGYADGIGVVMALHKYGHPEAVKIAGCELWLKVIERLYKQGKTFYFVGGKQEVIDDTITKVRKEYAGVNIVGYRNGYIKTDEERQALIADVVSKRPDVVFVAMGSPKQELLMGEMMQRHAAIYQGLGGSFDVYTGHVKRAPQWWIGHKLEFLYRFLQEPSRYKRERYPLQYLLLYMLGKI